MFGKSSWSINLPVDSRRLTRRTSLIETWKPRIALGNGTANRKRSLWQCGFRRLEEANAAR